MITDKSPGGSVSSVDDNSTETSETSDTTDTTDTSDTTDTIEIIDEQQDTPLQEEALIETGHTENTIDGTLEASPLQAEPEITREQLALTKKLFSWRTIVPLLIVLGAVVFFALPNLNLAQTAAAIRSANVYFLLAAFVVYYLTFPLRAYRWRMLLENVGFTKANGVHLPKFWKIVEIIFISWFANAAVPAKLGDMYRAYLLREETGVSGTRSFGTVLAERLLDLIILLLLCIPAVIISLREKLPWQVELVLIITLSAVIIGVIALFLVRIFRDQIERLVPKRFRSYYTNLQEGTLGSFRRLPVLTGLTIGVWVGEAMRFFFVAFALNLFSGSLLHIVAASFFVGLVEALLTVIPFTSGGVGLVEGGMAAMIILLNPNALTTGKALAAAAIVLDRVISWLSVLVLGFIVFIIAMGKQTVKQPKKILEVKEPGRPQGDAPTMTQRG